jgi:DNA polymerase-3 subunit delta
MDAVEFLKNPPSQAAPLYVLHGDEAFLKRQALRAIRVAAVGAADADDQAMSMLPGDKATFAEVFDELDTLPFFYPRRLVVVDAADPFVTANRAELETKVGHLSKTATLVLDVKTWPANTRLAKLVSASATLVCKSPQQSRLAPWCVDWAKSEYSKQMPFQAAALLVELVGVEMGLLDQELKKLAIYVGDRSKIELEDVDRLVGNNRAANTWKIFDEMAAGNLKEGLAILHRLFDQGEEPMRLLGAFTMQLRRLAQAYRLTGRGLPLTRALELAGVPPFGLRGAEAQLRHLGRRRLDRLYDDLLQMHLDLRGNSPLPERTLFERFLIRLARKTPQAAG